MTKREKPNSLVLLQEVFESKCHVVEGARTSRICSRSSDTVICLATRIGRRRVTTMNLLVETGLRFWCPVVRFVGVRCFGSIQASLVL
jgi:hypothetical protein